MSLLRELQAATYANQPLTAVLRRAMVFAARLENSLLHEWARNELNGYPKEATLPAYRQSRSVAVRGNFIVHGREISPAPPPPPPDLQTLVGLKLAERELGRHRPSGHVPIEAQLNDVPINSDGVPSSDRDRLFTHRFLERVAVYEDWWRTQMGDLRAPWPREDLDRYRYKLGRGTCLEAWQVLARPDLIGVVEGVLNGLLYFAMELERAAPDAGDVPASQLSVSNEQVTNVVCTIIYTEGGPAVSDNSMHMHHSTAGQVIGGNNNLGVQQGDVSITQQSVDLNELVRDLRTAVDQLEGRLPPEQLSDARERVEDLEDEAKASPPRRERMLQKLEKIRKLTYSVSGTGAAVIDAVQAIQRALDS